MPGSSRGTIIAIAFALTLVHVYVSKHVSRLHDTLSLSSKDSDLSSSTIDLVDSVVVMLLGYSLALSVSSAAGVIGVLKDNTSALRLFALASLFDLLLCWLFWASSLFLTCVPLVSTRFGSLLCSLTDDQDGLDDCERTWKARTSVYLVVGFAFCCSYLRATALIYRFYSTQTKIQAPLPLMALPTLEEEEAIPLAQEIHHPDPAALPAKQL